MPTSDPWPLIHAERAALVADLDPLSKEQWATPSLCQGWSVQQVLGHMVATAELTTPKFFAAFIGSGFRFNAMTAKEVARETAGQPSDTLARYKERLTATTHPPGPIDGMLGEGIVHGEDIRRPLHIVRTYPTEALTRVADFYKGSNLLIGGKKRVAGLTLRATDADWSTGSGPQVSGPMLSLVMVIAGRKAGLADLSGEGLATLTSRT